MSPPEPAPRPTPYRVGLVCLGNICRSPMAEVVLTDRLAAGAGGPEVEVASAGTGPWHVGDPMDERAAAVLTRHGYDPTRHRGRQADPAWLAAQDLVLVMDAANRRDVAALLAGHPSGDRAAERVAMFRDYDPVPGPAGRSERDVPDPYYGGADGFDDLLAMVERTADALVARLTGPTRGTGLPRLARQEG